MKLVHTREPTAVEIEVEQCVLGLLLTDAETADAVLDQISLSDILEPLHARIVESVRRVLAAHGAPNPLSVSAAMATDQALATVGGVEYLRRLHRMGLDNRQILAEMCEALGDQAQRRALAREIAETETRLYDHTTPAADILAEHQAVVLALAEGRGRPDDPVSWYQAGESVIERLERPKELRSSLLPFGIAPVDDAIGGMGDGDLIIMAGRPGMGKTALALCVGHTVARPKDQISFDLEVETPAPPRSGVFMVSLEMKHDALLERGLSMRAFQKGFKVPYGLIRRNRLGEVGHDALIKALADDAHLPFIIDHRRSQTVSQIGTRIRRAQMKMRRDGVRLGLAIIDHLGLIEPDSDYRGNKVAEISAMTKGLKNLAGILGIPILCLSQLSRRVEERDDKRPYLSDLRDSGSIEQDADQVLLLHRPEYYLQKSKPDTGAGGLAAEKKKATWEAAMERAKGKLEIHIAKNRHGAEATVTVDCDLAYNWIGQKT